MGGTVNDEALELSLANDPQAIAGIAARIDAFCEARNLPPQIAYAVNLSVDEILTNTISYGYDDDDDHRIVLTLRLEDGTLVVVIVTMADPSTPRWRRTRTPSRRSKSAPPAGSASSSCSR